MMDAIRSELATGLPTGGKVHTVEGQACVDCSTGFEGTSRPNTRMGTYDDDLNRTGD